MRHLTEQEKEALWLGLSCRRNLIETGDANLSAKDLEEMDTKRDGFGAKIKALSLDQMKIVILSYELITKIVTNQVSIED